MFSAVLADIDLPHAEFREMLPNAPHIPHNSHKVQNSFPRAVSRMPYVVIVWRMLPVRAPIPRAWNFRAACVSMFRELGSV